MEGKKKKEGRKEGGKRGKTSGSIIVSLKNDEGGICKAVAEMKICSLPSPHPSVPKPSDNPNFSHLGNSHFAFLLTLVWMGLTGCPVLRVVYDRLKQIVYLIIH